ncbi:MAG: EBNA-1 nuclear protein [Desulfovibrio sp. S3730MH75]|nr:MAG: EBNA-1 nuclear protein [Desulfovibrio sp. S3730MH75]
MTEKVPAIVYCDGFFGKMDGKTANGLARYSGKYEIVGIIDSTKAGLDAGEVLDGIPNGIKIFKNIVDALEGTGDTVKYFIYGMAPLSGSFSAEDSSVIFYAMERKLNIINGLHEFLTDKVSFIKKAAECNVELHDIRKQQNSNQRNVFTGNIDKVECPRIAILGTDSAVGKRTTSVILTKALQALGLNTIMIATGQTGVIQGAEFGVPLDALTEQFISGEMEKAVFEAWEAKHPDIMILEGQGSLSHPAYLSSCFIIRGGKPDAVIVQHPPKREKLGDYPDIDMPDLKEEIELIEVFSRVPVIGITINHENMSDSELTETIEAYKQKFEIPTTDVLKFDCEPLIKKILTLFPHLNAKLA